MVPLNGGAEIPAGIIHQGYQNIFQWFKQIYPDLPDLVLDEFRAATHVEQYPKKTVLIDYGDISRKLFIVVQGYVNIYLNIDGIEKPVWFINAGRLTVAVESYLHQVPSRERQVAVEDTICIVLDYENYQQLFHKYLAFERLVAELFKWHYFELLFRIELSHHAPKARYLHLLKHRPDIFMNATISDLAKYLGIARETLSRKRAELRSGDN